MTDVSLAMHTMHRVTGRPISGVDLTSPELATDQISVP